MKELTLQFVPYGEISGLESDSRLRKLMGIVKQNKIVLLQGKLSPEEEALLIEQTMGMVNARFKGIELCTVTPKEGHFFDLIKKKIASMLIGERDSMTIIGPATIIKEIKRDPRKVQLLLRKMK